MAAFKHVGKGVIKHVSEGSWQHDYMLDNPDLWTPATDAEVAASIGVYVPPAEPESEPDVTVEPEAKPAKVHKQKTE